MFRVRQSKKSSGKDVLEVSVMSGAKGISVLLLD
jgi:hypothetical protein